MIYEFEIKGNHLGLTRNPLGYTRTTQGLKWSDKYKNYQDYKNWLVMEFWHGTTGKYKMIKPFQDQVRGKVIADISFNSEVHPDPDNVVKAILDSLFVDDKEIDVETSHQCKVAQSGIKIRIEIS